MKWLAAVVTLHVSVWVEIVLNVAGGGSGQGHAPRERVSWNVQVYFVGVIIRVSRSTWACELKYV